MSISTLNIGRELGSGTTESTNYATVTSNITAKENDYIYADTTANTFTITLPGTPDVNKRVHITDVEGTFDTNNIIVSGNGNTIMGLAEDMTVSVKNVSFALRYTGSDWRIV